MCGDLSEAPIETVIHWLMVLMPPLKALCHRHFRIFFFFLNGNLFSLIQAIYANCTSQWLWLLSQEAYGQ